MPRLTSSSTLVRPARRALRPIAARPAPGVVTAWRLTDMIRSPRCRPFSAASLFGSTAVMITPRAVGGRLPRGRSAGSAAAATGRARAGGDRRPSWPSACVPLAAAACAPAASSVGRWPTCTVTVWRRPSRMISSGTRVPTGVLAIR